MSNYRFEIQHQRLIDGTYEEVPVCMGTHREILPETAGLLSAAAIIGPTLHRPGVGSLSGLVEQVGGLLEDDTAKGIIIEDELGAGAVRILPEVSTVDVRLEGMTDVPTEMLFDMLDTWNNGN